MFNYWPYAPPQHVQTHHAVCQYLVVCHGRLPASLADSLGWVIYSHGRTVYTITTLFDIECETVKAKLFSG